jgi:hypothetical protein
MSKREEAQEILKSLGLPKQQQNERSCLTLLALAGLSEDDPWSKCRRPLHRIWDIMAWMKDKYGKEYAANSRETIRRQTVHQFEQARLINRNPDDPSRPTNSGDTRYPADRRRGRRSPCVWHPQLHEEMRVVFGTSRQFERVLRASAQFAESTGNIAEWDQGRAVPGRSQ